MPITLRSYLVVCVSVCVLAFCAGELQGLLQCDLLSLWFLISGGYGHAPAGPLFSEVIDQLRVAAGVKLRAPLYNPCLPEGIST